MDQQSVSALTGRLESLRVFQRMQPTTDGEIPSQVTPIQLVEDARCGQCGGHGHWHATCDFLEHTGLSGRILPSLPRLPDDELRFHLCLPWTVLRCGSILRSNSSSLQTPKTIDDAICLLLDFTAHLADYAKFRWLQYRMLNNMWCWLQTFLAGEESEATSAEVADRLNDSRHISKILAAWNALAEEATRSLRELIGNLLKALKEFERAAIIMPIASKMTRFNQPPMPGLENKRRVLYSEVWDYIISGQLEQILATPLSQQAYQSLLTEVSDHRATYTVRQAEVDRMFCDSVTSYQEGRRDPRFLIAFALLKILALEMDAGALDALRAEDFAWPDREGLLMRWSRAMNGLEQLHVQEAELGITSLLDTMSL
ncbi:hypothetical protein G647_09538 [Cladophialophora carrionii CBS 160.54]|uniref:Uncharacterized protein n=1 Tax=Cladophialophora carrionii CBS 160.54 TaxID=1279043 RepID=V9DLX0_9EURO|nr:uncharacterized protein G647_09538 [Cladophialophora carrionii CBS 160.54]ETI27348.1 hypothetical protein G647_09538 [Cladophialophora carrionii CBS 160.54]